MPWGCENFQDTSDQQESYNKFGFRAGQYPQNVDMLLTSKEQPVARTCTNLQSDLNIFKCLKCPPTVEMIIQSREVVQFRSILLHHETWGMPDELLRP